MDWNRELGNWYTVYMNFVLNHFTKFLGFSWIICVSFILFMDAVVAKSNGYGLHLMPKNSEFDIEFVVAFFFAGTHQLLFYMVDAIHQCFNER